MPFAKPWDDPQVGDLMYGVNSDMGRKYYINYHKKFKNKVFTVDSLAVMTNETNKTNNAQFLAAVATHQKYRSALTEDSSSNEATRRKCKAGLEWAVSSGKNVHFALDDLDLNAVIDKNWDGQNRDKPATDTAPKNRSITGSELRWIYRNRHRVEVQRHIQFWMLGDPCAPPWEEDVVAITMQGEVTYPKTAWQRYVPSSEADQ